MSRPSSPRLTSPDKLDVSGTRLTFKGDTKSDAGSLEHRHYAVDIELFAEASIKGEPRLIGKSLSVVLQKKGPSRAMHMALTSCRDVRGCAGLDSACLIAADYWPRLTKEKVRSRRCDRADAQRVNFVKTDVRRVRGGCTDVC